MSGGRVGYRFLCFAGSETFFRSLALRFFSLCCCLCLSRPSLFAFLVLVILWDSVMHGDGVGVFKRFCVRGLILPYIYDRT